MQISRNGSDFYLNYFLSNESEHPISFWLTGLYVAAIITSGTSLFRSFIFCFGCLNGSEKMFNQLLESVIGAGLGFFEATPTGRLLSRFSGDVNAIDDSLPFLANIFLAQLFALSGLLLSLLITTPLIFLLFLPLSYFYYYLQFVYRRSVRELKRIDSVTRGKIFASISENASGLRTIRAFNAESRISKIFLQHFIAWQELNFTNFASSQWMSFRLQSIGLFVITFLSVYALLVQLNLIPEYLRGYGGTTSIGLALTYAYSLTSNLEGVINFFTETEKQLIAVERVLQFSQIPSEADLVMVSNREEELHFFSPLLAVEGNAFGIIPATIPLATLHCWPTAGKIEFQNVSLRYAESAPLILHNISFCIPAGRMIGVIGKTGSGKSSLIEALLQTRKLTTSGKILIDDVDIATVPLSELRSSISVLPQKPCLFTGSFRFNLLPYVCAECVPSFSNEYLTKILDACGLSAKLASIGSLVASFDPNKELSSGEKQLLCFARVLLQKSKLIIMDECSADIDLETDARMQDLLYTHFRATENPPTILIIAHRLETLAKADEILVMHDGHLIDRGPPSLIFQKFTA